MNDLKFERRTKVFAQRVVKLDGALPQNTVERPIASQLIRGTSIQFLKHTPVADASRWHASTWR